MAEGFETRFHRLVDILYKTQARAHTVAELSRYYQMTPRNIQRDLALLREARFPLDNLGRGRGHRLDPTYRLPQNALSLDELVPLVLGNALMLTRGNLTAQVKLRAIALNGVERSVVSNLPPRVVQSRSRDGDEWLETLSAAIASEKRVRARYGGRERTLEPWSLLYQNMLWYVHAWDVAKNAAKRFRLNRFEALELLPEKATAGRLQADAARFHPWDLGEETAVTAVLRVTPELERWLLENPAHPSQHVAQGRATFEVRNRPRFFGWLLSLHGATLETPANWRAELATRLRDLLTLYT